MILFMYSGPGGGLLGTYGSLDDANSVFITEDEKQAREWEQDLRAGRVPRVSVPDPCDLAYDGLPDPNRRISWAGR